jgi:aspartate/methionine/tyrosine aminotransferase
MKISRRTQELGTESAFEVLAQVNALKKQGKDVISFCIGQPDFDTPNYIKQEAIKAINDGKTCYTDSAGAFHAREAVARYFSKTRNIDAKPDHVVIANGAKQFIAYAIACTTDPAIGDEVIYPNPGYPIYESQIRAQGAIPIPLPLLESKNFSFSIDDLKKRITKKTRLLILNTPQNPTGSILSREDLEQIAQLAKKHDFWVYSDEIYSQIIYDQKFESIASIEGMYERTIISDGLSKAYAMTGWRLGFVVNPVLAPYISTWVTNIEGCANNMTQHALCKALDGPQDDTKKMVSIFKERRNLIVNLLNQIDGVSCHLPNGAFYVYANVTKALTKLGFENSVQLQEYLLEKHHVAVLADTYFGKKDYHDDQHYIRLSYATSTENIKNGVERIKNALNSTFKK